VIVFAIPAKPAAGCAKVPVAIVPATSAAPFTNPSGDIDVLQKGQTFVVQDILELNRPPAFVQMLLPEGLRSYVKVPLMVQQNLIGSLNVGSDTPNVFTEEPAEG